MHYNTQPKNIIDLFKEQKINYFGLSEITDFSIESMYLKKEKERRECVLYLSALLRELGIGQLVSAMPKNRKLYLQIKPENEEKYWLEICKEPQIQPYALDTYNTRGTPFFTDKTQDSML